MRGAGGLPGGRAGARPAQRGLRQGCQEEPNGADPRAPKPPRKQAGGLGSGARPADQAFHAGLGLLPLPVPLGLARDGALRGVPIHDREQRRAPRQPQLQEAAQGHVRVSLPGQEQREALRGARTAPGRGAQAQQSKGVPLGLEAEVAAEDALLEALLELRREAQAAAGEDGVGLAEELRDPGEPSGPLPVARQRQGEPPEEARQDSEAALADRRLARTGARPGARTAPRTAPRDSLSGGWRPAGRAGAGRAARPGRAAPSLRQSMDQSTGLDRASC